MTIRFATDQDKPELVRLCRRFLETSSYGASFPATDDALRRNVMLTQELGVCFVADTGSKLVGMLAVLALPHQLTEELYADELAWFVEPEHRNGTIGPRLLVALERWATSNGVRFVTMLAPEGSDVGAFLARRGYVPLETRFVKRFD